jgi:hypothetical protein
VATWIELDAVVQRARDAANHHDSPAALKALDEALLMMESVPAPEHDELRRMAAILRQGLVNARDGVWAMLYDQAFLDLDLVHALPAALGGGTVESVALTAYLGQALEPFKGRIQRAM